MKLLRRRDGGLEVELDPTEIAEHWTKLSMTLDRAGYRQEFEAAGFCGMLALTVALMPNAGRAHWALVRELLRLKNEFDR